MGKKTAKIQEIMASAAGFGPHKRLSDGMFGYSLDLGGTKEIYVFSPLPIKNIQITFDAKNPAQSAGSTVYSDTVYRVSKIRARRCRASKSETSGQRAQR